MTPRQVAESALDPTRFLSEEIRARFVNDLEKVIAAYTQELNAEVARLREALLFIRDESDWDTFAGEGGGGDCRIGPAIDKALAAVRPAEKPTGDQWRACAEQLAAAMRSATKSHGATMREHKALAEFDRLAGKEGA